MHKYRHQLITVIAILFAVYSGLMYANTGDAAENSSRNTTSSQSSKCPQAQISDVWLDKRLSCLSVGQRFIDISSGATGITSDTAYIIRQSAFDLRFNNILKQNAGRHFKYFLCVRNIPANVSPTSLASDLAAAIALNNYSAKPAGISAVSLEIAGTTQPGFLKATCDPSKHPVIVNFETGLIESVNEKALSALESYEK